MMTEHFLTIEEFVLNNNCPECYSNNGLRLTFKQKVVETTFYKSITNNITGNIACKTCKTKIYPVQWTNDIERVFEYHQKALQPKKASTYFKKRFWGILIATLLILLAILFFTLYP